MSKFPELDKERLLKLLMDMGYYTHWYPEPICQRLIDCGLPAQPAPNGEGLTLEGEHIRLVEFDGASSWGEPGIGASCIVEAVYRLETGENIDVGNYTGSGFTFDHMLRQLYDLWKIETGRP